MRALIVSTLIIIVLIASWGILVSYTDKNIHDLMNTIEEEILISLYAEDFDKAADQFSELSKKWHKQKKVYSFFFNAKEINDADFSIARTKEYIHAKNVPLAAGELNCIKEQLKFLHSNELLTLDNLI